MKNTDFEILGIGAWGPTFRNWPDLLAILQGQNLIDDGVVGPKPEVIPKNERRRAPLPVRLAVESSWQAVSNAGLDPADVPSVFVSGIGDTQLTDYMCKALVGENKALSPTKFHNSVHNAAAGYWTISTGCMCAASSVAGFQESVSLTLMEALIQCETEKKPILITFYDAPSSLVLKELLKNEVPFSVSLVISPLQKSKTQAAKKDAFSANVTQNSVGWPEFSSTTQLEDCYRNTPTAKILALLRLFALKGQIEGAEISFPLSSQTSLNLRFK